MIRIHEDSIVPKYHNGCWSWDETNYKIDFNKWINQADLDAQVVESSSGFTFRSSMNQLEELIFRQEFTRPNTTFDADVILLQDIKNVVLFLAPSEILSNKFITFVHTRSIDWFLNALIIYFEYFIRLVEYILVRRDELSGKLAQVESIENTEIKRIYSEYLSQYRLILAREYSTILMGNDEMKPFYHITPVTNISKTIKDRAFHESFLAFCTQVVWIAHHRRAYDVIDDEMNRLFRSEYFKLNRKFLINYNRTEQELLYGRNNKRANFRYQNSPLIMELAGVERRNLPILWIGERKYNGTDLRIKQLEIESIIPDSQLNMVDMVHGILGHPKIFYNTLLQIVWDQLRQHNYSEQYDPYRLIRQPYLTLPKLDILKQKQNRFDSYFEFKDNRFEYSPEIIKKWKKRDKHIECMLNQGLLKDIVTKCQHEVNQIGKHKSRPSEQTTAKFLIHKQKFLKPK